jgi:hypothetical protein
MKYILDMPVTRANTDLQSYQGSASKKDDINIHPNGNANSSGNSSNVLN